MLIASFTFLLFYAFFVLCLVKGIIPTPGRRQVNRDLPFVSVLVAARDEQRNIKSCLHALLAQKYPAHLLEIIVIDDNSTDATAHIVREYASKHKSILLLQNSRAHGWKSSKKEALHTGLERARGSIVLLTDADCRPTENWIASIVSYYTKDVGLVAGFSPQQSDGSDLWNAFLLTDSLAAALVTATSIGLGRAATCAGRNLSYKKEAMQAIGGYEALPDTLSGDDDFVLQRMARSEKWRLAFAFCAEAHVPARGPQTFSDLLKQKQRHLSAGKSFNPRISLSFGAYHALNFSLWAGGLCGIVVQPLCTVSLLIKIMMDYFILFYFSRKLKSLLPIRGFLLWEILFPLYHLLSAPVAFVGRAKWKN